MQCSREAKEKIKDPRFETMADAGNCISSAKVCDTVNDCLTNEEKSADENIDCSKIFSEPSVLKNVGKNSFLPSS